MYVHSSYTMEHLAD